jgi:hypothetical protein
MLPLAILLSLAGTYLLFDAHPGINWGIWATLLATGIIAAQWSQYGRVGRVTAGLALLGTAFAWGIAVTANEPLTVLSILAAFIAFSHAVLAMPDEGVRQLTITRLALGPIEAPVRGVAESGRKVQQAVVAARREEALPVLRGAGIALPVVGVFALALSAADPVFAAWRDRAADSLDHLPVGRVVFGLVLFIASLGALGLAARTRQRAASVPLVTAPPGFRLGFTERLIPIASAVALFACFLVLQVSYLFGNAPAVEGSGITFAEYARRGFVELTFVAVACGALLVLLRGGREHPGDARVLRVLELVLIAELALLLASAFRRIVLYEEAYGFTMARVWGQAFMVTLAAGLVVLGRELAGAFDVHRLVRRQAALGAAMLLALTYWNHEAWIARRNVERFDRSGQLDLGYLAEGLSANAVPQALLAARRAGGVPGICADLRIRQRWAGAIERPGAWYEWNAAIHPVRSALSAPPWYTLTTTERSRLLAGGCAAIESPEARSPQQVTGTV